MNIVLSNISYAGHTTSEGNELQLGLEYSGAFILTGRGYGDECRDVPTLIERYSPKAIVISDPRDWYRGSGGSFGRRDLHFERHECLRDHPEIFKCVVMKDAGTAVDFQSSFAQTITADALITYYHDKAVLPLSPWADAYKRIRIRHSIDADLVRRIDMSKPRRRSVVTGAVSNTYPLRKLVFANAPLIGVVSRRHPGYGASKCHTPDYLQMLAGFKTHVATCSSYNFALRKIIESVVVGCTPITNLPSWDVLPEIDDALVRIPTNSSVAEVRAAVDKAESQWNLEERMKWAKLAVDYYGYRSCGMRLAKDISNEL